LLATRSGEGRDGVKPDFSPISDLSQAPGYPGHIEAAERVSSFDLAGRYGKIFRPEPRCPR